MMLILTIIKTLLFCIIFQSFLFKLLKINKKLWPHITIILYICLSYFNYHLEIDLIEYLVLHSIFLTCYILFLTIIFNESPSIFFFQNIKNKDLKKIFQKKNFVKKRLNLLKTKKLITSKNVLTKKGSFLYKNIIILSNLFLNEIK
jgi:hypothetical protein